VLALTAERAIERTLTVAAGSLGHNSSLTLRRWRGRQATFADAGPPTGAPPI
jgi:hypothetical protein